VYVCHVRGSSKPCDGYTRIHHRHHMIPADGSFIHAKKMPPLDRRNKMNLTICSYPSHCSNSKVTHTQKAPNIGFVVLIRKRMPRFFRVQAGLPSISPLPFPFQFLRSPTQKLWPHVCSVPPTLGGRIHLQLGATTN
jgi:hypothetical protein